MKTIYLISRIYLKKLDFEKNPQNKQSNQPIRNRHVISSLSRIPFLRFTVQFSFHRYEPLFSMGLLRLSWLLVYIWNRRALHKPVVEEAIAIGLSSHVCMQGGGPQSHKNTLSMSNALSLDTPCVQAITVPHTSHRRFL